MPEGCAIRIVGDDLLEPVFSSSALLFFRGRAAIRIPSESPSKSWWKMIAVVNEAKGHQ